LIKCHCNTDGLALLKNADIIKCHCNTEGLALLKNADIIKVNQDAAALAPYLVDQTPPFGSSEATTLNITAQIFARPLSAGRLAVLLLNRGPTATHLAVSWKQLHIPAAKQVAVYDVIKNQKAGKATGFFSAAVPSHDVAFVILEPVSGEALHTARAH
jgi:hypothetical protein